MRNHSILALVIIALLAGTATEAKYSGGTGEPNDPYKIATAEDLNDIGNHLEDRGNHFKLIADIDLSVYTGTQFNIIGKSVNQVFGGVFDGNQHIISNFTWLSDGINYVALFGYSGGQIRNLGMEGVNIQAGNGSYVGGLVGINYSLGITNCFSTGRIFGKRLVGGLVGLNYGAITACYSKAKIMGIDVLGGLVGEMDQGTITSCYTTGGVSGTGSDIGGLVGWSGGTITNCYSTSAVSGNGGLVGTSARGIISYCYSIGSITGHNSSGGLVGHNRSESIIIECYSASNISADQYDGGLVGFNEGMITDSYSTGNVSSIKNGIHGGLVADNRGTIINCYSTGSVSGTDGGLVGLQVGGQVTASFWDQQTSGQSKSAGGTPKTTAEMKTKSTFTDAGWDFMNVWDICEGTNYPKLIWQIPIADFACPDGVDFVDLGFFVDRWLADCDKNNNFCNCTDINYDGRVNFLDFAIFASHWLEEM